MYIFISALIFLHQGRNYCVWNFLPLSGGRWQIHQLPWQQRDKTRATLRLHLLIKISNVRNTELHFYYCSVKGEKNLVLVKKCFKHIFNMCDLLFHFKGWGKSLLWHSLCKRIKRVNIYRTKTQTIGSGAHLVKKTLAKFTEYS